MSTYAIIRASGSQHHVTPGQRLTLHRLPGDIGSEISFDEVLLVGGATPRIGLPLVDGARVTARIVTHDRGDKIRVFKRRRRKGFHKTIGHRQALTRLEILAIEA